MQGRSIKGETAGKVKDALQKSLRKLKDAQVALATKNRELEIEASLEAVRIIAMGMKVPADMLDVCRIISQELKKLGVKEIRNVQTAIIDEEKASYLNYEYFRLTRKKIITRVEYKKRKDVVAFVRKMLKDPNGFFTKTFKGAEIKSWIKYQTKTGQYVDPHLKKIKSLHYYFYSIGPGALGVSSYGPASKETISMFKRFRNVFQLAYQRFIDLQKAEAQAREAQIQLALERVRARTMAMQKSDEFSETAYLLFQQFKELGENPIQITIGIFNEDKGVIEFRITGFDGSGSKIDQAYHIPIEEPLLMQKIYSAWKQQKKSIVIELTGKELRDWINYRSKLSGLAESGTRKINPGGRRIVSVGFFSKGLLSISKPGPIPGETIQILERFAGVFDLTYTRFLDLKTAEAQAREAQIELGLERVRARAMAMQKSDELAELIDTVQKELTKLEFILNNCIFWIMQEEPPAAVWWVAPVNKTNLPQSYQVPFSDLPYFNAVFDGWKKRVAKWIYELKGKDKKKTDQYLFTETDLVRFPDEVKQAFEKEDKVYISFSFYSYGGLHISTKEPLTEEQLDIINRFSRAFDMTYTRFLDLQKAEAQAREAQIEAALERVRSRTMGMQKSTELRDAAAVLFQQAQALGARSFACGFNIWGEEKKTATLWMAQESMIQPPFTANSTEDVFYDFYEAAQRGESLYVKVQEGKELEAHYQYMSTIPVFKGIMEKMEQAGLSIPTFQILHCAFFSQGFLLFITYEPVLEIWDVFKRFAKVFEQTYTRFLDLQKAEAQARESQIELALERVRARTIAMHRSEEIADILGKIFEELKLLDVVLNRILIWIFNEEEKYISWWSANSEVESTAKSYRVDYNEHPVFLTYLEAWQKKIPLKLYTLSGAMKDSWEDHLFNNTGLSKLPKIVQDGMRTEGTIFTTSAISDYGLLMAGSFEPLSDENTDIIQRFGRVFQQSYTRYIDVQKAEAQAREAKIEAALERVRSKAMAMHKTADLNPAVATVFEELDKLDLGMLRCGIGILYKDKRMGDVWTTAKSDAGNTIQTSGDESMDIHPLLQGAYEAWLKQGDFSYVLEGEDLVNYYRALTKTNFQLPESVSVLTETKDQKQYYYVTPFESGTLFAFREKNFTEEAKTLMKRFAGVFNLTYKRFLDLQKAEAQAKEAQIEAALERVRSRTMGMQKSEELKEVIQVVYEQFVHLNILIEHTGFIMDYKARDDMHIWLADQHEVPFQVTIPYFDCAHWNSFNEAKEKGMDFFANHLSFEEKNRFYQDLFKLIPGLTEETKEYYFSCPGLAISTVLLENVGLYIENFSGIPYSDEENATLMRFGKVFQQTYTRFLDLQKAEAQAREAQIEGALERVRSRTMAMHKSSEVMDIAVSLYAELEKLGFTFGASTIIIIDKASGDMEHWTAGFFQKKYPQSCFIPYFKHPYYDAELSAWKSGEKFFVYALSGEEKRSYDEVFFTQTGYKDFPEAEKKWMRDAESVTFSLAFMKHGAIHWGPSDLSEEQANILQRFANVFEQSYTRFLDLQKAELQAREARIEAAMEKVRSRAMAMQKADELVEVAQLLRKEMGLLGVEELETSSIYIHDEDTGATECWYAIQDIRGKDKKLVMDHMTIYLNDTWVGEEMLKFYKSDQTQTSILMQGENRKEWVNYCAEHSEVFQGYYGDVIPERTYHLVKFSNGYMGAASPGDISQESWDLLKRATTVFSLAYTRFSDLKLAEAQTREATIEAALERVRGRAMAMHNSNDLSSTASMVFTELRKLGINPIRCGVGLLTKESRKALLYSATSSHDGDSLSLVGWVMLKGHPVLEEIYETWLNNEDCFPELSGEQLKSYYEKLLSGLSLPSIPDWQSGEKQYGHFLPFSVGCLYAWSETPYNDGEIKVLKRFASIIDLTFKRYMDLQKSEASAKEAVKQAALDRIRADIASMRTITDLDRITPLIWNELTILGVPFIRCGVFIMDEEQKLIHTFLSTPDGKAIAAFHIPYSTPGNIERVVSHWHDKKNYVDHWDESAFTEFAGTLVKQGVLDSPEQYLKTLPQGGFYLHFLPFLQGMLYVGNTTQLGEEEIKLLQSVADAFSTAYARYEDFNKLEGAKYQIEKTLVDLKQAQTQLVQSEKMASLGELTAGIAHEIQNPLNFVNNFSEVSGELLDEMKGELATGNGQQAMEIADDVKQNLEKILHHGKRADAIVKGMLQHSRTSTGQKEPTDINILADEYLRLAYHGLRAKDKSFNAKFETDLDKTIEKINVVPQEIGRVILNLINNAFYTVTEKKRQLNGTYEPTVSVSTKKLNDSIEIKVKDNGNGIPQKVMDKIFQPFFTTKPTGQGTGLGLSLSYDIITKGHAGELKVETREGEGSEFIIQLPISKD